MNANSTVVMSDELSGAAVGKFQPKGIDTSGIGFEDAARFHGALSRQAVTALNAVPPVQPLHPELAGTDSSLGKKMFDRAAGLADGMKHDQQYVSKVLEQATRTGDTTQLMKAMMALSDYQIKVQTISKTVSKAVGALDQLTKLQ